MNTIELLYRLRINGIDNWTMEFVGSGQDEYVEKMKELISNKFMNLDSAFLDSFIDDIYPDIFG